MIFRDPTSFVCGASSVCSRALPAWTLPSRVVSSVVVVPLPFFFLFSISLSRRAGVCFFVSGSSRQSNLTSSVSRPAIFFKPSTLLRSVHTTRSVQCWDSPATTSCLPCVDSTLTGHGCVEPQFCSPSFPSPAPSTALFKPPFCLHPHRENAQPAWRRGGKGPGGRRVGPGPVIQRACCRGSRPRSRRARRCRRRRWGGLL